MSDSAVLMLGMAIGLSVLFAGLILACGYGFFAAFAAYSIGGTTCLLVLAYSAHVQSLRVQLRA